MARLDIHEVSQMLAARIDQLAPALLGTQPSGKTRIEWRWGSRGSLAIVITGAERGQWFNHEAGIGGDALDLVCHIRQCNKGDAWRWGLVWLGSDASQLTPPPAAPQTPRAGKNPDLWQALWREAVAASDSPVERYLKSRGLALWPDATLRFHPACPRREDRFPAMLAPMFDPLTGAPVGLHRTFLRPDGSGKADVQPAKMMLGSAGAIHLSAEDEVTNGLGICEGIENGLAVLQRAGWAPIWACGSAGAIARFPVLSGVESLTIFCDHDQVNDLGKQPGVDAARACRDRWMACGREVIIQKPPAGTDWLDALGSAA